MSSFGTELYDNSASLGVAESYIGLIVAIIVGIVLVIVAIYLFSVNQKNLVNSVAKITSAQCIPSTDNHGNVTYSCNMNISYVVNGKEYNGNITTDGSTPYATGENVDITYDSTDPSNVTAKEIRDSTLAWILLAAGVLIVGGAGVKYYLSTRYKMFAAAEGASSVVGMFRL